jgi:hypothetical protein
MVTRASRCGAGWLWLGPGAAGLAALAISSGPAVGSMLGLAAHHRHRPSHHHPATTTPPLPPAPQVPGAGGPPGPGPPVAHEPRGGQPAARDAAERQDVPLPPGGLPHLRQAAADREHRGGAGPAAGRGAGEVGGACLPLPPAFAARRLGGVSPRREAPSPAARPQPARLTPLAHAPGSRPWLTPLAHAPGSRPWLTPLALPTAGAWCARASRTCCSWPTRRSTSAAPSSSSAPRACPTRTSRPSCPPRSPSSISRVRCCLALALTHLALG